MLPVPHADFFRPPLCRAARSCWTMPSSASCWSTGPRRASRARDRRRGASLAQGITYAASTYRQESLGDNDRAVLDSTRALAGVRYAVSYVRTLWRWALPGSDRFFDPPDRQAGAPAGARRDGGSPNPPTSCGYAAVISAPNWAREPWRRPRITFRRRCARCPYPCCWRGRSSST